MISAHRFGALAGNREGVIIRRVIADMQPMIRPGQAAGQGEWSQNCIICSSRQTGPSCDSPSGSAKRLYAGVYAPASSHQVLCAMITVANLGRSILSVIIHFLFRGRRGSDTPVKLELERGEGCLPAGVLSPVTAV